MIKDFETNNLNAIIAIMAVMDNFYSGYEVYITCEDGRYTIAVEEYTVQKKAPAES